MKKEVSRKITFINLIMACSIVLYHYYGFYNEVPMHQTWDRAIFDFFNYCASRVGGLALGVFFLMSGFLLYNHCEDSKDMKKKIIKRIKSLGIPFIIWNVIVMIYLYVRTYTFPFKGMMDFIAKCTITPFDGPLWYIFALLLLLPSAYFIIKLKKSKILSFIFLGLVTAISFSIVVLGVCPKLENWEYYFALERFLRYLPIYFIGAFAGMHCSEFVLKEKYKEIIMVIFAIVLYLISAIVCKRTTNPKLLWVLSYIIQPILFWFAIPSKIMKWDIKCPFNCSFIMYAMHGPIILSIYETLVTWFIISDRTFYPIVIVLIKIAVVIAVYLTSVLITYFLKKIMKEKYFDMLSGGRI